jgi:hypothetical protein
MRNLLKARQETVPVFMQRKDTGEKVQVGFMKVTVGPVERLKRLWRKKKDEKS